MTTKIPSAAQAKRLAKCWADDRPINMMQEGRDGAEPYNDATNLALLSHARRCSVVGRI